MRRVLVFCAKDWRVPDAGLPERYCYQVFSRMAQQGDQVSWVCQDQFSRLLSQDARRGVEVAAGIQVARLGLPAFHPMMASILYSRLANSGKLSEQYDVVVDCVNGRPMRIPERADVPVLPLVFRLGRGAGLSDAPPNPLAAASERARQEMLDAGLDEKHIVYAPYGADTEFYQPGPEPTGPPVLTAVTHRPGRLLRALAALARRGVLLDVTIISVRKPWTLQPGVTHIARAPKEERLALYQESSMGYVDAGTEHEAAAMAACGLPVVAPETLEGIEHIRDGETGLLHAPRSQAALEEQLTKLAQDSALRRQLGAQARQQVTSWDKTTRVIQDLIGKL